MNTQQQDNEKLSDLYLTDKQACYNLLFVQLSSLIENETYPIANLANASALLNLTLPDINWVGFYLLKNKELVLGPFQGKPACIRIPVGKGVCGTAVAQAKSQLVPDVHAFPGHIACDSASNSEIVIPIIAGDRIVGVLDIDSPEFNRFDQTDLKGLEEVARILADGCNWDEII